MIQEARSKAVKRGFHQRISLAIADGHALPFRARCAHWCVSVNVLLHVQDYEEVLKQMAQVLRKGGRLIANFPILQSAYFPIGLIVNLRKRAMLERVYSRWFTLAQIRRSLFGAGFRIEDTIGLLLVTKQATSRFADVWLMHFMRNMGRVFARTPLRYLSGMLFVRSQKP
jgi:ubiquinone/menaquinone biosynthesis C-methylase UbiE